MPISFIRTILLYTVIIFAVKLMGKRQISELQTSELVVTLLISNIASIPMQNTGQPLFSGILPIVVLICCEIFISKLMLKSQKFRQIICGKPVVIVNNGKIVQKAMKELRMSTEDLSEQLRQLDIFSIQDIAFAIVETNGKLSVLKKPQKLQPDASMLGIVVPDNGIETVVISDGVVSDFSLDLCHLSKNWLYDVLQKQNVKLQDVFIMTANKNKNYNIIKKEMET